MHSVVRASALPVTAHVPIMTLAGMRKSFGPVQALKGVDVPDHARRGSCRRRREWRRQIDPDRHCRRRAPCRRWQHLLWRQAHREARPAPNARGRRLRCLSASGFGARSHRAGKSAARRTLARRSGGRRRRRSAFSARIATDELRMPVGKRVAELSLAQLHIVEIARALATNPKVLFLDEPTEPLQHADVRKLFDLIGELKRDGVGIVYVSHRLHEVDELADRISVMRDGEIIDSRLADSITSAEIVALIAGRRLARFSPPRRTWLGHRYSPSAGSAAAVSIRSTLLCSAGEIVGLAGIEGEGQRGIHPGCRRHRSPHRGRSASRARQDFR